MAKIPARLYHGTSIECLAGILVDVQINASQPDDYDDGHAGVSLTSSLAMAEKFAEEAKERDWEGNWNSPVNDGVIFVLNSNAIWQDIGASRVIWDGTASEREYRTHGAIPNVIKYLVQIRLDAEALPWWINAFKEIGDIKAAIALQAIPKTLIKHSASKEPPASPPSLI
jgi:hypothetical protein